MHLMYAKGEERESESGKQKMMQVEGREVFPSADRQKNRVQVGHPGENCKENLESS